MLDCFKAIMEAPGRSMLGWEKSIIPPSKRPWRAAPLWAFGQSILISSEVGINSIIFHHFTQFISFLFSEVAVTYLLVCFLIYYLLTPRVRGPSGQENCLFIPPSSTHSKHRKKKNVVECIMNEQANELIGQNDDH